MNSQNQMHMHFGTWSVAFAPSKRGDHLAKGGRVLLQFVQADFLSHDVQGKWLYTADGFGTPRRSGEQRVLTVLRYHWV